MSLVNRRAAGAPPGPAGVRRPSGPLTRTGVRDRLSTPAALTTLGVLAVIAVVVGATGTGHRAQATLPAGPLGLWRAAPTSWRGVFAVLAVIGMGALVVAFVRLHALSRSGAIGTPTAVRAIVAWAAPLLLAPPMLSLDAYAYAAQGRMVVRGLDPYVAGPEQLARFPVDVDLLTAIDPVWRDTPVPYGPVALAVLRLVSAGSGGDPVGFVLLLRLLALAAVVLAVVLAARLAVPERRAEVVVLVGANPIVLLHLIGGPHLDALLAALAAVVLVAARSRWWWLAGIAAVLAFSIKLPGLVLVGYVLLARLRGPHGAAAKSRAVLAAVAVLVPATIVCGLVVPHGWGWVGALGTPGTVRTYWAPATLLGGVVRELLTVAGFAVSFDASLQLARVLLGGIGALGVLALLWRGAAEPSWRRAGKYVGLALVVLAVSSPVVYAWYLVWGLVLVATCGSPRQRALSIVVTALMVWSAIPPVLDWAGWIGVLATVLSGVVAVVVALPRDWRVRAATQIRTELVPVR
jgi:hypothetical protein